MKYLYVIDFDVYGSASCVASSRMEAFNIFISHADELGDTITEKDIDDIIQYDISTGFKHSNMGDR